MDTPELIFAIIFTMLPFWGAAFFVPMVYDIIKSSRVSLWKPIAIIGIIVLFLSALLYLGYTFNRYAPGFLILLFVLPYWTLVLRSLFIFLARSFKLRKEGVLFKLGRLSRNIYLYSGGAMLLIATSFIFANNQFLDGRMDAWKSIILAFQLSIALNHFIVAFSKTLVTRDGLLPYSYARDINWQDIKGYRWGKHDPDHAKLTLKYLFDLSFAVPREQRFQLDEMLKAQDIPQLPA